MRKVSVLSGMVVLAVLFSVVTTGAFQQTEKVQELRNRPHPSKKKANFWVHRRQDGDPDPSNALAVVIHIKRKPLAGENDVVASITRYTSYDAGSYQGKQPAIIAIGELTGNGAGDSREREFLTLKEFSSDAEDPPVGYVTFYKGRGKANSDSNRKHHRAVFRWNSKYVEKFWSESGKGKQEVLSNCDLPPEDDPMEEEDMTAVTVDEFLPIPEPPMLEDPPLP